MAQENSGDPPDVAGLLEAWKQGDRAAFDALVPLLYEDLRRRAHHVLSRERDGHTLQTTALVHETYLKLVHLDRANWSTRAGFLCVAAQVMRRILVDYARARNAAKRGAGIALLSADTPVAGASVDPVDILALDESLGRLAALDGRQARIVELRYFAGLSIEETAETMDISPALVKQEWKFARAWLFSRLAAGASE